MLRGEWPGNGCEHCKHIEEAGGESDRTKHLEMEGTTAPPELDNDPEAVEVTPRILEVYSVSYTHLTLPTSDLV